MGDSDDEYDRRRARDKFRRERSDYNDRRREREDRSSRRDDWSERRRDPSWENRRRGDYREFERGRRDSSGRHHEMSPPMKRVRRDWDDPYHGGGGGDYSGVPYGGGGGVPAHHNTWTHPDVQQMQAPQQDARQQRPDLDQQQQASQGGGGPMHHAPAMMTFKQFLNAQDDNIGDEEAVTKYQEYKLEFRKTQMSDFFQQHKEEEWFRTRYHPKDAFLRQKEVKKAMRKRLSVFLNLLKAGRADDISLDIDNAEAVIKLLDAVVLKLEGGTDDDLAVLDRPATPSPERRRTSSNPLMSPRDNDDVPKSPIEEKKKELEDTTSTEPSSTDKKVEEDTIPEAGPVSPSSVPLPSAPPPASVKAAASAKKKAENGDVKVMSVPNPTPEQQQLQQQAQQYYHQQQLYYQQQYYAGYDPQQSQQYQKQYQQQAQQQQQQPQTSQPQQEQPSQQPAAKEDEPKKKRKRRHREPYYYDAMDDDESESESESDSEPEPAPPGEEMSPMETGKEDELVPPGVEAEAPSTEENLLPPGVDEPEVSQAETSVQLPTSSSNSDKHSTVQEENKPDSCEPAVGSSQPETSTTSNGEVTEGGSAAVDTSSKPETSDDTAADSTQEPDTKEAKQTCQVETSSPVQAESSSSVQEKDTDQVGSTDNAVSVTKKTEDVEMTPESSSEAQAQEKLPEPAASSQEAEPSSASSELPPVQEAQPEQQVPIPQEVDSKNVEVDQEDSNKIAEKKEAVEEESPVKPVPKDSKEVDGEEKEKDTVEEGEEKDADGGKELVGVGAGPRALHKTFSLFMRSVPPNISKAEISVVCKRFAGYLRVALSDPSPDRKFFRRGWITFDRSVNIKEICWGLNNIRIKDVELSPVVNRDLSRRVRPVAAVTTAKQVIRDDIKLAARLIRVLDKRAALYEKESREETEAREKAEKEAAEKTEEGEECEAKPVDEPELPDLPTNNPIIASLSEDATEEEEGEEMELLGTASPPHGETGDKPEVDLTRDSGLLKVLDRLILYLRVVHSLDYYNSSDYPYEDEMPNRCGIIHVRGATPEKCTQAEVQEWQKSLNQKLEPFLQEKELLNEEEVLKLGRKDPEAETEKFVEANTQELAKDKWLCPLSGKKFRGPDFVRKHIFNKHMDKVDAVRMEAEFFNSYLSDPRRPQIPDAPSNQRPPGNQMGQMYGHQHAQGMMGWGGPRPHMMMYGPRGHYTPPTYGGYGNDMYGRGGHTYPPKPRRFGFGGGRNKPSDRGGFHRDPRQIVQYRDLDAPDDADAF